MRPEDGGFAPWPRLSDGVVRLVSDRFYSGDRAGELLPTYRFTILDVETARLAGACSFRPSTDYLATHELGQVGYGVEPVFRGRGYAGRATLLLARWGREQGMTELWITTDPENHLSRRVMAKIGAEEVETVVIPESSPLYAYGSRAKVRFRLGLD